MRDKLFFHMRKAKESRKLVKSPIHDEYVREHTYCVKLHDCTLYIGYSIVHEKDMYCKKSGR